MEKYVNLENAREKEQAEAMKRIEKRGKCPFCRENLEKEHKEGILKEGKFWLVTKNQWKYDETDLHLLFIAKEHAESLKDLKPEAGAELLKLLQWAEKEFQIKAGGACMRFGDINYNGATVAHFHVHFLKPKDPETTENYEPIRFRIGGRKKPRNI